MIRKFLTWLFGWLGFSSSYKIVIEDDIPESVSDQTLYLIGEQGNYWLAVMKCPCGCGDSIQLPMTETARPCWRVTIQKGIPTLAPSVNRTAKCKSHFILKAGQVVWC